MSVNEEKEFIKQNKGFTQVEPKLEEKWTDLKERFKKTEWKFVKEEKFQDVKFFKDKKWNADCGVFVVLEREEFSRREGEACGRGRRPLRRE